MLTTNHTSGTAAGHKGAFATTHWTNVLTACQLGTDGSVEALERLCHTYWQPLFAFLRRSGYELEDAQDLTQSFFVHLLENKRLARVSPAKGRFRSFLLASLRNFLINEWDKGRALKRGSQFSFVPLDCAETDPTANGHPAGGPTPETAYEQRWALTLLECAMNKLREEYSDKDKQPLFEVLQTYLSGDRGLVPYAEMAGRLNLTEGALKMAVLRLRRRFGEILRAEVALTVGSLDEIDEEIRCLFAAVASG